MAVFSGDPRAFALHLFHTLVADAGNLGDFGPAVERTVLHQGLGDFDVNGGDGTEFLEAGDVDIRHRDIGLRSGVLILHSCR